MTLVADANVAVKWFIQQQGSDHARRVQSYRGALIAPAMLIAETTNGFWRHVVHGDVSPDFARTAVIGLPRWFAELVEDQLLGPAALDLAVELNYPLYDCIYLALSLTSQRTSASSIAQPLQSTGRTSSTSPIGPEPHALRAH